jgi:hypothetical protein
MAVAAIVAPANVITYDANPAMVADARRNFTANYMDDVHAEIGMRRNRSRWSADESEVDFFLARDFWASRLAAAPNNSDITSVVNVPLVCLEARSPNIGPMCWSATSKVVRPSCRPAPT